DFSAVGAEVPFSVQPVVATVTAVIERLFRWARQARAGDGSGKFPGTWSAPGGIGRISDRRTVIAEGLGGGIVNRRQLHMTADLPRRVAHGTLSAASHAFADVCAAGTAAGSQPGLRRLGVLQKLCSTPACPD